MKIFCPHNSELLLWPPANEVWGKVTFLHLSVSHSVHGGCYEVTSCYGQHPPRRTTSPLPRTAHTHPQSTTHPLDSTNPGQQAGGTNPTGMLSCLSTRTLQVLQLHKSKNSNAESSS